MTNKQHSENEIVSLQPIKLNDSDIYKLHEIGCKTFSETFLPYNPASSIDLYLKSKFNEEQLKMELMNVDSIFYFAEKDNKVIGYLKVNSGAAQTEQVLNNSLEIERIYVLSDFHGKNVGQKLFELTLKIAYENNKETIWLGVWKKNKRAIRFYEKNGFVQFDEHIFMMGDKEQTDILMKLELE